MRETESAKQSWHATSEHKAVIPEGDHATTAQSRRSGDSNRVRGPSGCHGREKDSPAPKHIHAIIYICQAVCFGQQHFRGHGAVGKDAVLLCDAGFLQHRVLTRFTAPHSSVQYSVKQKLYCGNQRILSSASRFTLNHTINSHSSNKTASL